MEPQGLGGRAPRVDPPATRRTRSPGLTPSGRHRHHHVGAVGGLVDVDDPAIRRPARLPLRLLARRRQVRDPASRSRRQRHCVDIEAVVERDDVCSGPARLIASAARPWIGVSPEPSTPMVERTAPVAWPAARPSATRRNTRRPPSELQLARSGSASGPPSAIHRSVPALERQDDEPRRRRACGVLRDVGLGDTIRVPSGRPGRRSRSTCTVPLQVATLVGAAPSEAAVHKPAESAARATNAIRVPSGDHAGMSRSPSTPTSSLTPLGLPRSDELQPASWPTAAGVRVARVHRDEVGVRVHERRAARRGRSPTGQRRRPRARGHGRWLRDHQRSTMRKTGEPDRRRR